jgi:hypothetical protein
VNLTLLHCMVCKVETLVERVSPDEYRPTQEGQVIVKTEFRGLPCYASLCSDQCLSLYTPLPRANS